MTREEATAFRMCLRTACLSTTGGLDSLRVERLSMIDAQHVRSPPRILLSVFLVTAPKSLRFVYLEPAVCQTVEGNVRETILLASQFLCLAFFPSV